MTDKKPRWKTVSIPVEVWEKAKKAIENGETDMYHTPSELIIDAARRRLEELEKIQTLAEEYNLSEEEVKRMAKLEHINIAVNGNKTIIAVRDHTDNRIYDVVLSKVGKRVKLFCMGDESFDCVHVKYVWHVIMPKLKEYIELYRRKNKGGMQP